ncbi:hypothetical protein ACLB2K_042040 [Fragaria x ananassa]
MLPGNMSKDTDMPPSASVQEVKDVKLSSEEPVGSSMARPEVSSEEPVGNSVAPPEAERVSNLRTLYSLLEQKYVKARAKLRSGGGKEILFKAVVDIGIGEVLQAEAWCLFHGLQLVLGLNLMKLEVKSDWGVLVNLILSDNVEGEAIEWQMWPEVSFRWEPLDSTPSRGGGESAKVRRHA